MIKVDIDQRIGGRGDERSDECVLEEFETVGTNFEAIVLNI